MESDKKDEGNVSFSFFLEIYLCAITVDSEQVSNLVLKYPLRQKRSRAEMRQLAVRRATAGIGHDDTTRNTMYSINIKNNQGNVIN